MKKALFALLLATAASANAAPITVTFDYTGLWHEKWDNQNDDSYEVDWQPSGTLSARFTAEDINGNNTIEEDEVTSLIANGIEFIRQSTHTTQYSIGFRYRNTTDYDIYVKQDFFYDNSPTSYFYAGWTPKFQWWQTSDYRYYEGGWGTTDTVATVVSVPSVPSVPEPTTFAMLGLGLSIIGLSRRRINATAR